MVNVRGRLFLALLAVLVATALLLSAALVFILRTAPQWGEEEQLRGRATELAAILEKEALDLPSLQRSAGEALEEAVRARIVKGEVSLEGLKVTLTDRYGGVTFDSDAAFGHRLLRQEGESAILTVSVPVTVGGDRLGKLSLSRGRRSVGGDVPRREKIIVVVVLLGVGAALLASLFCLAWAVRPVEELARRLDEAEKSLDGTQYVEKYVQTLTHEMKSPLSVLQGAAELLGEEMSDEQHAVFVGNIRRETERIQDLVDRLLQLSAIEGRRELRDVEHIDLASLVSEVADGMAPVLAAKEIAPDLLFDGTPAVWGERFLLRQALVNILKNAVEFSPTGGSINLRLGSAGDRAVLTVDDAGPGIPDYALKRIFEKFYSLGRPDTGRRSSGLGLPFAREVAALHGGDVSVENMTGGGVRVRVRLPLEPPPAL
jgi:two-component system sensor histidine kinase CreC